MKSKKSLFRKLFAFALVCMLAVMNVVPAMAQTAEPGTYTITINNNKGLPGMEAGQFTAYQIFAGRVDTTATGDRTLADITWGNGVNAANLVTALKAASAAPISGAFADIPDGGDATSARAVAAILTEHATDSVFLQAFAKIVHQNVSSTGISSTVVQGATDAQDKSVIDVSENGAGYYLVVETNRPEGALVYSSYMLDVVGHQVINLKASVPTVDKEIVTGPNAGDRAKTDSVGIGDTVKFEITGTLAQNYGDFSKYTYKFVDTMSKGLTLTNPADFKVTIDGHEITLTPGTTAPGYTVTPGEGGTTKIEVDLGDLKVLDKNNAAITITKDSTIVLTYSATLNSSAVIGNPGNPNDVKLVYSNNPNDDTSTDDTPNDKVTVYTYELDITKVAENNTDTKLEGAEFYLSRQGASGTTEYYKVTDNGEGQDPRYTVAWVSSKEEATKLTTGENGNFNQKVLGLDAGVTYTLTEETAPNGYNKIDPFTFTITATVDASGITSLTVTDISSGDLVTDITATSGSVTGGKIAIQVEDPKAPLLPFAGGMGTMIFYVVGGLLVAGAALYLVFDAKKRKVKGQSL